MINEETEDGTSHIERFTTKPGRRPGPSSAATAAESPSQLELLSLVRIRWKLICAATLCGALTGIAAAFLMTPVYRATTLLMPAEGSGRSEMLNGVFGDLGSMGLLANFGIGKQTQMITTEAIALLRSRQFIEQFIHKNRLMPVLFWKEWDAKDGRWKSSVTTPPTPWRGFKLFVDNILSVRKNSDTDLVTLHVDWTNRVAAADWANELVNAVNERIRERTISQADQTIRYLNRELKAANTIELKNSLYAMLENEIRIQAIATVRKQYAFEVLDPAAPPDPDVMLRPRKKLYIASGPILGFGIGFAIALLLEGRRSRRGERAPRGA